MSTISGKSTSPERQGKKIKRSSIVPTLTGQCNHSDSFKCFPLVAGDSESSLNLGERDLLMSCGPLPKAVKLAWAKQPFHLLCYNNLVRSIPPYVLNDYLGQLSRGKGGSSVVLFMLKLSPLPAYGSLTVSVWIHIISWQKQRLPKTIKSRLTRRSRLPARLVCIFTMR